MPSLENHTEEQQRTVRQERAAAFWQRTIDDGRQQRQAGEQLAQTERQDHTERQERREAPRHRMSL
ncbi:MAG: hypothetical protein ACREE4_03170 [Stellaceae bacterium]